MFFFFACLLRERDGRAGATKRKTFYVWRSRKAEGMLCRTESECLQVHFEDARPFPPFNVTWNRNRISSLWRNVTGSLGLFVLASVFDWLSPTSIVEGYTRASPVVPCRVDALVQLFPETRDGLHPPWTLRSNVGPSFRRNRDRHITAFVAVESFSSPPAAISVKTIARRSGCTGRRSCQSWDTLRYDVLTQGFQNFSTPWAPKQH